jgi:protein-tyrosine phosphatase
MFAVSAVLLLCTANVCRSVMAQAMLSARLAARGVTTGVASAGVLAGDRRAPPEVISVMADRGLDVSRHMSRVVTAEDLEDADLILGLAREHVRHAAVLLPAAWPRAFTLRELVRRGRQAGPRAPGEPLGHWLDRAADGRDRAALLGCSPADDVADPVGGPLPAYQATAYLLDLLARDLVELGWPSRGLLPESRGSVLDQGFLSWRTRPVAGSGHRPFRRGRAGPARRGQAA